MCFCGSVMCVSERLNGYFFSLHFFLVAIHYIKFKRLFAQNSGESVAPPFHTLLITRFSGHPLRSFSWCWSTLSPVQTVEDVKVTTNVSWIWMHLGKKLFLCHHGPLDRADTTNTFYLCITSKCPKRWLHGDRNVAFDICGGVFSKTSWVAPRKRGLCYALRGWRYCGGEGTLIRTRCGNTGTVEAGAKALCSVT